MKIGNLYFENGDWIEEKLSIDEKKRVDLVLVFSDYETIQKYDHYRLLKVKYPNADIVGASTAGNIIDDSISDLDAVGVAITFDTAKVRINSAIMDNNETLIEDAHTLVSNLEEENLKHIFVLGHGLEMDNSKFVKGLNANKKVSITGGLAADGNRFEKTKVFANESKDKNLAVAIGFYGESLHVEVGCKAGWEEFGAQRVVTKSNGNTVYEIDDKPALELYEKYLGEYIKDLPESGLLFPLSVESDITQKNEVIRVMMGINEDKSILFAGDIPQGSKVRLMKTNIDNLIDGAELVAKTIQEHNNKESLSISVSCSGRLSVLKQLADEEIEVIKDVLGDKSQLVGFYSYGEIAPFSDDILDCKLHNQTMTLTTIYED